MQQDGSFRAIVNRLTVTPVEDLPRIAGFLATSLASCPLEIYFSDAKTNNSSVTTHKLKTRITSLLQDRSSAGRLCAVVLIKAIIENGGPDLLAASEPWVRGLLGCLNKTDPPEVKRLHLFAITRIFILTQYQPALVREIATPLLPSFITACLNLIKPITVRMGEHTTSVASPLLEEVLQCWLHLLPQYAPTFRPFLSRIKALCLSLIGNSRNPRETVHLSTRLLCLLVSCAPKNTTSQEWFQICTGLIESSHETASKLFRSVIEEHESNNSSYARNFGKQNFAQDPEYTGPDKLGLASWKGITAGSYRLATLVSWLETLLSSATLQSISLPMGPILDLTSRIIAITVAKSQSDPTQSLRFHNEASRDEKEDVLLNLPTLHISCLHLLRTTCTVYGQSLCSLDSIICDQALAAFEGTSWHPGVRAICYDIFTYLFKSANLAELELNKTALSDLILQCCDDLKSALAASDLNKIDQSTKDIILTAKSSRKSGGNSIKRAVESDHDAFSSAWKLVPEALSCRAAPLISRGLRVEMDRLAILLDHREAMLSSILNPVISKGGQLAAASVLPFLTRSANNSPTVEAFLRPRFPVTQIQASPITSSNRARDAEGEAQNDDKREDILSQLENSLNEMDNESDNARNTQALVEGLHQNLSTTTDQVLSPKKRVFEDLGDRPPQAAMADLTRDEARTSKRQRPDEYVPVVSESLPYEASNGAHLGLAKHSEEEMTLRRQKEDLSSLPEHGATVVSQSAPSHKADNEDSDSSDFEIPKIDTGFDTDEEEEEDDIE